MGVRTQAFLMLVVGLELDVVFLQESLNISEMFKCNFTAKYLSKEHISHTKIQKCSGARKLATSFGVVKKLK